MSEPKTQASIEADSSSNAEKQENKKKIIKLIGKIAAIVGGVLLFMIVVHAIRLINGCPGVIAVWPEEDLPPKLFEQADCQKPKGFEDLGEFPGSEDVEVYNDLVFVSVGLRYDLFAKTLPATQFQGIYVYNGTQPDQDPVKIPLANSNPHGINLFKLDEENVRIFVVSHVKLPQHEPDTAKQGKEEVIVIDYSLTTKTATNEMRLSHDSMISVNDIVALSKNKFVATNDFLTPEVSTKRFYMDMIIGDANVIVVDFDENAKVTKSEVLIDGLNMANGINYENGRLVVNEPTFGLVHVYKWDQVKAPVLEKSIQIVMIADNVNFDAEGNLLVAGWMDPLSNSHTGDNNIKSIAIVIDGQTLEPKNTIFYDIEGKHSFTSAARFNDDYWMGSASRPLLLCQKN